LSNLTVQTVLQVFKPAESHRSAYVECLHKDTTSTRFLRDRMGHLRQDTAYETMEMRIEDIPRFFDSQVSRLQSLFAEYTLNPKTAARLCRCKICYDPARHNHDLRHYTGTPEYPDNELRTSVTVFDIRRHIYEPRTQSSPIAG